MWSEAICLSWPVDGRQRVQRCVCGYIFHALFMADHCGKQDQMALDLIQQSFYYFTLKGSKMQGMQFAFCACI